MVTHCLRHKEAAELEEIASKAASRQLTKLRTKKNAVEDIDGLGQKSSAGRLMSRTKVA